MLLSPPENSHRGKEFQKKCRGIVLHYRTKHRSLFNKSSHDSNCSNNYVWLNGLITFVLAFDNCFFYKLFMVKINKMIKNKTGASSLRTGQSSRGMSKRENKERGRGEEAASHFLSRPCFPFAHLDLNSLTSG